MQLPPGTRLGPYEVVAPLGAGGMGEVYRAKDTRLGRDVAVKVLSASLSADRDQMRRFEQEARAASALNHPNIVTVYDVGRADTVSYIALELVVGQTLRAIVATGPLPLKRTLGLAGQVAEGLAKAHAAGIVHRDLKPENIMVTNEGLAKILDFGLAKLEPTASQGADASGAATVELLTEPGTILGTTSYMSPEQASGRDVDFRSDQFSFGAILYEMLTGSRAFSGASTVETLAAIVRDEPVRLASVHTKLPAPLCWMVERCLAKDPEERYGSTRDLARDLQALAQHLGTIAPAMETSDAAAGPGLAGSLEPTRASLVVLPFADLSPGKDNEYFSDGITAEIIAALSKLDSLRVISRTSTMTLKNAKQDIETIKTSLNVGYVLEGSVRKAGDALRIAVQLIDATKDAHLWSDTYAGTLGDVFDIQEKVARSIAEALRLRLSPSERVGLGKRATADPEAFDTTLRARACLKAGTKKDVSDAIALFQKALARDLRYAGAHAGLAEAYATWFEFYEHRKRWLEQAGDSALKALMYDASLPEAYAALALASFNKGALDDALAACHRAIELDATNFIGYWILARIHFVTGQHDEAIAMLHKVIELDPDYYPAYFTLRMVYQESGDRTYLEKILSKMVDEVLPRHLAAHPDDARAINSYGMELTQAGRGEEGRVHVWRALEKSPDDPLILYATACYEAMFGTKRAALDLLKRAVAAGYLNLEYLRHDPDLKSLRDDPEYEALLEGMTGEAP
jgi:serine/threonine protein kinase/tetratricopeptide (TPR) repeat protein